MLAHLITSDQAQRAYANHPQLRPLLTWNPRLAPDIWLSLWDDKPDQYAAMRLFGHPVHPDLITRALRRERRKYVLAHVIEHQELTSEHISLMTKRKLLDHVSISTIIRNGRYPLEVEPQILAGVRSPAHADALTLTSRHQFDQDLMLKACAQLADGNPDAWTWWAIDALLTHPNAGPDVVAAAEAALRARYLPVTDSLEERSKVTHLPPLTRPWEDVDTDDELDLLLELRGTFDMPHVTKARVLARWAERTATIQPALPTWETASQVPADAAANGAARAAERTAQLLCDQLDAGPAGTWAVAAALLADNYSGTLGELVRTSAALATPPPGLETGLETGLEAAIVEAPTQAGAAATRITVSGPVRLHPSGRAPAR
jgi:hypothetical protein